MTRTAIRHTLSAIAALALASAFTAAPASAQAHWDYRSGPRGQLFSGSVQKELSLSDEQKKPARPAYKPGRPVHGDIQFTINEHSD